MSELILEKRRRGRPKGSEMDDTKTLQQVAEMLVNTPKMPAMTAMRRVMVRPTDAALHRVNRKWRDRGVGLLAAAREKRNRKELQEALTQAALVVQRWTEGIERTLKKPEVRAWIQDIERTLNDPKIKAFAEGLERLASDPRMKIWLDPKAYAERHIADPIARRWSDF